MSHFKNYLKEAAVKRGLVLEHKNPFKEFMIPWLFRKYNIGTDKKIVEKLKDLKSFKVNK